MGHTLFLLDNRLHLFGGFNGKYFAQASSFPLDPPPVQENCEGNLLSNSLFFLSLPFFHNSVGPDHYCASFRFCSECNAQGSLCSWCTSDLTCVGRHPSVSTCTTFVDNCNTHTQPGLLFSFPSCFSLVFCFTLSLFFFLFFLLMLMHPLECSSFQNCASCLEHEGDNCTWCEYYGACLQVNISELPSCPSTWNVDYCPKGFLSPCPLFPIIHYSCINT